MTFFHSYSLFRDGVLNQEEPPSASTLRTGTIHKYIQINERFSYTTSLFLNFLLSQPQSIHEANKNKEQGQVKVNLLLSIDHTLAERSV